MKSHACFQAQAQDGKVGGNDLPPQLLLAEVAGQSALHSQMLFIESASLTCKDRLVILESEFLSKRRVGRSQALKMFGEAARTSPNLCELRRSSPRTLPKNAEGIPKIPPQTSPELP